MKKRIFINGSALFILLASTGLQAQTPSDALMMEAKQACVLLDYNFSSFDKYWEGELKRENQTIGTVQRQSIMPMVAIGILDDLNFYVGVPYIKTKSTEPNGGKFAGVSGFQDLTLAVKYRWVFNANNELLIRLYALQYWFWCPGIELSAYFSIRY